MAKHTHRYRRVNIGHGGKEFWVMKCVDPECTHYTPMASKLSAPLLKGNMALCNRCNGPFILNKRALRMAEPCCDDCVNKKITPALRQAEDFWTKLEQEAKSK